MENNPLNTYNPQENTTQNPNTSLEKKGFFTKTKIFLIIITLLVIGGLLYAQYYNQVFFSSKKPEKSLEKEKAAPAEIEPTPVILSTSPLTFNVNNYELELLQNATFQKLEEPYTKMVVLNTSKTHPLDSDTNTILDKNSEFLNFELTDPNDLPDDQNKYEIVNFKAADSNLWVNDKIVRLPNPFEAKIYKYAGGSTWNFIIDLYKNSKRQELYTAVKMYAFSEDGKKLFIQNSVMTGDKRQLKTRVINIEKNTEVSLPNLFCIGGEPKWQGNRVIVGKADDRADREFSSDICVFDDKGILVARISANLETNVGIMVPYSLLPNDPDTFYAISSGPFDTDSSQDGESYFCSLYLLNIASPNTSPKFVNLVRLKNVGHPYGCVEFTQLLELSDDLNLENLKINSGNVEVRVKNNEESVKANSDIRTPWINIENNNPSQ